jgi:ubiquitin-like protein Pup
MRSVPPPNSSNGYRDKRSSVMPERERKQKPAPKERVEETAEVAAPAKQGEELKEELDDLLDEIDSVLETNAEEFVKSYVQKGGQ